MSPVAIRHGRNTVAPNALPFQLARVSRPGPKLSGIPVLELTDSGFCCLVRALVKANELVRSAQLVGHLFRGPDAEQRTDGWRAVWLERVDDLRVSPPATRGVIEPEIV